MRLYFFLRRRQTIYGFCSVTGVLLLLVRSSIFNILSLQSVQSQGSLLAVKGQKQIYTFDNKWQLTNICLPYSTFKHDEDFQLAEFTSNAGTISIFTHNSRLDSVSREIKTKGAYNAHLVNEIVRELREEPDVNVIDIGTNIGQFCFVAALMGRKCLGIDASKSNIQHACASAEYHKFGSKITLIHNAVSDNHTRTDIRTASHGDFGGIYVDTDNITQLKENTTAFDKTGGHLFNINSMTMDDLLTFPDISSFRKAFLILDVEGFEHHVQIGAHNFFMNMDVRGILINWKWHNGRNTSEYVEQYFNSLGFVPMWIEKREIIPHSFDPEKKKKPNEVLWYPYSRFEKLLDK